MARRQTRTISTLCRASPRVLSIVALVLLPSSLGCLNLAPGEKEADVDHVPVIASVSPEPTPDPVNVNIGAECRPETFRIDSLDDPDDDTLTVRWHLLFNRDGLTVREQIDAEAVPHLENPTSNGQEYKPLTLDLRRPLFTRELGAAGIREQSAPGVFQLLEVRVSDDGFVEGDVPEVPPGAGLAFRSWTMKLLDNDCSPVNP